MKAKIYRIVLPCGGTYVGQTKKHVYQRWGQHLGELDRGRHHNEQMQKSFDNNEVDDWKWEILESIETDDKAYINLMEQHYAALEIDLVNGYKIHVNSEERRRSYRENYNEYYHKNKEKFLKTSNEWYKNNKENKREYDKKYKSKLSTTH